MTALAFAKLLLDIVPLAIQGIQGAVEAFEWGRAKVGAMVEEDRDPTEAEWDDLNARLATLRDALHSDEI